MASKRKSVTFHEHVSMISPENFDGSLSPGPTANTPVTAIPPLALDSMYLDWLRRATKAHYPFIVNGTFGAHVYRQNFDEHIKIKNHGDLQRAQRREAAVPALAQKYGSLGWGTLHKEVSEKAWLKNYREIYRFEGSDAHLLEKIAEAYDEIKRNIAEEEKSHAQFTQDPSVHSRLSTRRWEPFTQSGGALISPDLGPGGVNVTFDDAVDVPFEEEEPVQASTWTQGENGHRMLFDMGVARRDFENAMLNAGTTARMLRAAPWQSGLRYWTR